MAIDNEVRLNPADTRTGPQTTVILRGFIDSPSTFSLDKQLPATYATYRQIRRQPTVAMVRALTVAPVVAGNWTVEAEEDVDEERVAFIEDQVASLREPLLTKMLEDRIDYGWSPWEKVMEVGEWDGAERIVLKKMKSLLVDLTDILVDYNTGNYAGLYQSTMRGSRTDVILDADETFLASFNVEGCNYYGRAVLENVRLAVLNWQVSNDAAERFDKKTAGTHWVVYYPVGSTLVGGVSTDNQTIANTILEALQSSGAVAVPSSVSAFVNDLNQVQSVPQWKVELVSAPTQQAGFVERQNYLDKLIVRGFLSPERSIIEGLFGTKADAGVHADLALTQRELEHREATRQVNWGIVDPLLAANYGEAAAGSVWLVAEPLMDSKAEFFREVYKALLGHPTASLSVIRRLDLDRLGTALEVPELPEGEGEAVGLPGSPDVNEAMPSEDQNRLAELLGNLFQQARGAPSNGNGRLVAAG